MAEEQHRIHLTLSGRVQGVGFRYYTYDEATRIGVTGFVRNLRSGDVEVVAEGTRAQLSELIDKVKSGPSFARVTNFQENWEPAKGEFREFRITH